jgi:hypothetical protein
LSTRRTKVSLPVSPRAPQDEKGLLTWAQKELHQFFIQVRDVINNLADAVGGITSDTYKVKVDSSQTPVYAEDAVAAGAGVTIAKTGTTPDKVLTIAATGDHKFATDATDEANGGAGYALDKLSSTGNVKPTLDTSGGQRRTQFNVTLPTAFPGFYEEDPEPLGTADPGDSALAAHGDHVHPPGDPAVTGGKLWTAYVQDPYAKGAVDAMYTGFDVCGATFLFTGAYTEGPTGTWTRNIVGTLSSSFFDDVNCFDGMVVIAWQTALSASELKLAGIYEIVNRGDATTKAVMRRVDGFNLSANYVNGMWFSVTGGTTHAGEFWQLTIPSPFVLNITDQEWASISEPASASTNALLTAAQIGRASTATVIATAQSDTLVDCTTTGGLLAGQTLLAGHPWECHLKVALTADDPAATTQVKVYLASTSGSFVLLAESAAIHNEDYETIVFAGALAADYSIPLGEELRLSFRATSDSVGGVEVNFIYNESDHPSWIQTPLTLGFAGTDEHDKLTKASRALPDQHPWSSMEPVGLAKVPFLGATLAAADSGGTNGKLALGASNRYLVDPDGLDLTQIQTPTVAAGTTVEVMVMFTAPCLLVPNVAPDTGYTKLHLAQDAGVTGLNLANPYSSMKFIYVAALSAFVRIQEAEL